ncbi:MAG: hypothetical protein EYC62_02475 [Alphaproteobacteria bacterium]|nr:MAG: hypothetical protein EYC62_02475 [Alphaproteobacteria bacterium]
MGKKAPKAPAAPDPMQSAEAQAQVNRLNQFFPGGGSLLYGQYDAGGNFMPDYDHNAVQLLESPYQKRSREVSEQLSLQLANLLGGGNLNLPKIQSSIDFSGINRIPTIDDFSRDAKQVEDATYNKIANLLRPEFEKRRTKRENDLVNQGIPMGSDAYGKEFDALTDNENETLQSAAQDAVAAGRAEQQRLFANAMAARQAQVNDQLQSLGLNNSARSSMLQELASLLGGQQFTPSQFYGGIQTPGVDVLGTINNNYAGQLNSYNNRLAQQRQSLQSIANLGSSLFGFL